MSLLSNIHFSQLSTYRITSISVLNKVKMNMFLCELWNSMEERRYNSTHSLLQLYEEVSEQRHALAAALSPGKGPPAAIY